MKQTSSLRGAFALIAALAGVALVAGCTKANSGANGLTATPQPIAQEQASAPAVASGVANDESLVRIQKVYGQEGAAVGQPYEFQIVVTALKPAAGVVIRQELPKSVEFRSSYPAADLDANGFPVWNLGSMETGDQRVLSLVVVPSALGNLSFRTLVRAQPVAEEVVPVGQPELSAELQGPEAVDLGENVSWKLLLTNTGSRIARDIRINAILPAGFTVAGVTSQRLPRLVPGQAALFTVTATPTEAGVYSTNFSVAQEGGETIQREAQVQVRGSQVRASVTGPVGRYIFSPATYSLTVTNTGGVVLDGLTLVNELPKGAVVLGQVAAGGEVFSLASGAPQKLELRSDAATGVSGYWQAGGDPLRDASAEQVQWQLPSLAPGHSQSVELTYYATLPGELENRVRVVAPGGASANAAFTTNWQAIPGIFTALVDSADPIRVGDKMTYTATVGNQSADGKITVNTLKVTVPDVLKIESAPEGAKVEGNVVTLTAIALGAKEERKFEITVSGARLGTGIAVMQTVTNFHVDPIVNEQSISVY